ncbi:UNVERIFIED_CONTAM: Adenylate cyclase type 1 [Trichonephila clavipes]
MFYVVRMPLGMSLCSVYWIYKLYMPPVNVEIRYSAIYRYMSALAFNKVHITKATLQQLDGQFEAEPGNGHQRDQYLADHQVETFLIVPTKMRMRKESDEAELDGLENRHVRCRLNRHLLMEVNWRYCKSPLNKRSVSCPILISSFADLFKKRPMRESLFHCLQTHNC